MISAFWKWFWGPTSRYGWGTIFVVGGLAGIIFWGGFNTAMEATNTLGFCTGCHEMRDNVYAEYTETIHYQNRTGVRATCSDCHVPDPWVYKFIRKIKASNELFHWALGTVDTPDKFENKRLTLAKNVWREMKQNDSRECRNCHSWDAMTDKKQKRRAWKQHITARKDGMTCIDCHKGVAHRPVHKLLAEDDDPYDGKPDGRRLPPKKKKKNVVAAATPAPAKPAPKAEPKPAAAPAKTAAGSGSAMAMLPGKGVDVTMLYPGQTSLEWVLRGKDHGGARAVRRAGDRCAECHKGEEADMGKKIVGGEKAEPTPIPGKRASIKANVKAAHDGTNLILQVQWPDHPHNPTPFADGGKMDPDNQIKLAVMFDDGKVDKADQLGCWVTCHHDSRYMPDQPKAEDIAANAAGKMLDTKDGITKYTVGSRTKIEYKGRGGKKRGAWDKLIEKADMDAKHKDGALMDVLRFKSGKGGVTESGYILAERKLKKADKSTGVGKLENGVWTVTLTRPLKAPQAGGVTFEPGKTYTVGFAIHDDFTAARFHHVSLEYRMALDDPKAEINVIKK